MMENEIVLIETAMELMRDTEVEAFRAASSSARLTDENKEEYIWQ